MIKTPDSIAVNGPGGIRRTFIRHPVDIPIEVAASTRRLCRNPSLRNLSLGGLAFVSDCALRKGDLIKLRIPAIDPAFEAVCEVMWCRRKGGLFEVGTRFTQDEDLYRLRMVEQVCHIEHYRRQVEAETGRRLSANEAAREWIADHADDFPSQESLGLDKHN